MAATTHYCPRCDENKNNAIDRPEDTICADCWDNGVVMAVEVADDESDHGYGFIVGNCMLAENYKEAAYRKLPDTFDATHILVYECRDCGKMWSYELDGGRNGAELHMEQWGRSDLNDILDWYEVR